MLWSFIRFKLPNWSRSCADGEHFNTSLMIIRCTGSSGPVVFEFALSGPLQYLLILILQLLGARAIRFVIILLWMIIVIPMNSKTCYKFEIDSVIHTYLMFHPWGLRSAPITTLSYHTTILPDSNPGCVNIDIQQVASEHWFSQISSNSDRLV